MIFRNIFQNRVYENTYTLFLYMAHTQKIYVINSGIACIELIQ